MELPWLLEHAFVSIEKTSRTVCEHDLSVKKKLSYLIRTNFEGFLMALVLKKNTACSYKTISRSFAIGNHYNRVANQNGN